MPITLDKTPPTLRHEPARGGQICGYQLSYTTWSSRASYCARLKSIGLYFCAEHHDWMLSLYGEIRMAPGNAIGLPRLPKRKRLALQLRIAPQGGE